MNKKIIIFLSIFLTTSLLINCSEYKMKFAPQASLEDLLNQWKKGRSTKKQSKKKKKKKSIDPNGEAQEQESTSKHTILKLLKLDERLRQINKEYAKSACENDNHDKTLLADTIQKTRTEIETLLRTDHQTYQAEKELPADQKGLHFEQEQSTRLNSMIIFSSALFLKSTTENELAENVKLGKRLSLKYHSDKTKDNPAEQEFFKEYQPVLLNNKPNEFLEKINRELNRQQSDFYASINPSLKQIYLYQASPLILPVAYLSGYYIADRLLPQKYTESKIAERCINRIQAYAFNIEKKQLELNLKRMKKVYN